MQLADRFHLMQNLRQALVRMLERRHRRLVAASRDVGATRSPVSSTPSIRGPPNHTRERQLPLRPTLGEVRRSRQLERDQKVMELHREGSSQRRIANPVGVNRGPVRRYVHLGGFSYCAPHKYAGKVDTFTDYLRNRFDEGCHNAP